MTHEFEQAAHEVMTEADRIAAKLGDATQLRSQFCDNRTHRLCPGYGWSMRHMATVECECPCHTRTAEAVAA